MLKQFAMISAAAVALATAGVLPAQEWGDLEGTIVYKGTAPTPAKIVADKDPAFCGKHMLVDEQITVNKANGGLADVVIYLFETAKPKIHPDYEKIAKETVVINNENCRFTPHVATLWTSQKLVIGSKDPIAHNTKADFFSNGSMGFNTTIPPGGMLDPKQFAMAEASPSKLECSIHPWMNSYISIREDPYAAVTDKDGKFTIKNIPVGPHTFKVWHQNGFLNNVTVDGKATMWARGAVKLTIKAGKNSLGKVEAAPQVK
jgi:hypothetical protein